MEGHRFGGARSAEIDESTVVVAELTDLNSNVLFEVGYAIASGSKSCWPLIRSDSSSGKELEENSGYVPSLLATRRTPAQAMRWFVLLWKRDLSQCLIDFRRTYW